MTTDAKPGPWTRRRLLQSLPAMLAPLLLPADLGAAAARPDVLGAANLGPSNVSPAKAAPFSRFVDVAASAGLTQIMYYGEPDHNTYIVEVNGAGCAFFDYDNDGWMDAFILGGRRLDGVPHGASNKLYHNNRDGTFSDVTEKAGLVDAGWACGVCVGDYNNDGFEDLYLTYYGQNRLYRNNGDGSFTDVTEKAGLHESKHSLRLRLHVCRL
jgi:enediyne biosynthesis protein E4